MSYTLHKNITSVNRTVMKSKENKYIVIHYTGNKTDTAKNNADYFKSVDRGSSAHYFVDKNSVYQVVEDKDAAWSVGKNYGTKNLFQTVKNNNSINIEMCSDNGAITDATFNNTVELAKNIMKKYNIPSSNVYRHFDICSKQCPGWKGWIGSDESLWNKFKSEIAKTPNPNKTKPVSEEIYRVRKSWKDVASQIGAYSSLSNAKSACKNGYFVFDKNGNAVYPKNSKSPSDPKTNTEIYQVKLSDNLNIRQTPNGKILQVNGAKKGGVYTIVETLGTWGRLKSGAGWISVSEKYVKRL